MVRLAIEILKGLQQLHSINIWHLDLKPTNVLLDGDGYAYLSDFGISHAVDTLQACTTLASMTGTPHYM